MTNALTQIVSARIDEPPLKSKWRGKTMHSGPAETLTPRLERLLPLTTCGCICLAAGAAMWGGTRFAKVRPLSDMMALAEAAFGFMKHTDILDLDAIDEEGVPEQPFELSAPLEIRWLLRSTIYPGAWLDNADRPSRPLFHLTELVAYVLAKEHRDAFHNWLDAAFARVISVARAPEDVDDDWFDDADEAEVEAYLRQCWGQPLPPQILLDEVAPTELAASYEHWYQSVDWARNPHTSSDAKQP